jgi:hypothetical protein
VTRAPLFAIVVACASHAALAQQVDDGWWVIVGSFPETSERMEADFERVNAAAGRCGFATFNDFSGKFEGFAPGYNVFVIGAYASKADAEGVLRLVRPCVPDAYLKRGRYLGE